MTWSLTTIQPDVLLNAVRDGTVSTDYATRLTVGIRPYDQVFDIFRDYMSGKLTLAVSAEKLADGAPHVELLERSKRRILAMDPRVLYTVNPDRPWEVTWKV